MSHAAPLSRQSTQCEMSFDGLPSRKVLQIDGYVDEVAHFAVCPIGTGISLSVAEFIVSPISSSTEVLPLSNVELQTLRSSSCLNTTALLVFDAMVGSVDFTLAARESESIDIACTASISFVVVGMTVYDVVNSSNTLIHEQSSVMRSTTVLSDSDPTLLYVMRSGLDNVIVNNYRDVLDNQRRAFNVRIQFPDGSSSSTRPAPDVTAALRGVRASVPVDASSPLQFNTDECSSVVVDDVDSALSDATPCGVALSMLDTPALAIRYELFKDGGVNISLSWPDLTADDEDLYNEEFSTIIFVSVGGDPPPLVEGLSAPSTMYRAGGQIISVIFDNARNSTSRVLRLDNHSFPEIPGSFRRLENGLYEAQFFSVAGNGTDIPWWLELSYGDAGAKSSTIVNGSIERQLSYATMPLNIGSLQPPWGSDSEEITMEGFFDGYDPLKDGHNIFIGDKSIAELGIVPTVDNEQGRIILTAPSRSVAGSAYEYPIRVVVNNETTGEIYFAYVPEELTLGISVFGGSYDSERGEHLLGTCEFSRYLAVLPSGVAEPDNFQWSLITRVDGVVVDLLESFPDLSVRSNSLTLKAHVFGGRAGVFVLSVTCVLYGRTLNADVTLRKTSVPVIGVSLPQLPSRSLMIPNIPVRIDAIITLPDDECFRLSSGVTYHWTYNNITETFSHSNMTDIDSSDHISEDNRIRPTRLGRELVIPQSRLVYGNSTISLLVYTIGRSFVSGNATTILKVIPADLQPVIGFGAHRIMHSPLNDLKISAARSRNPDDMYITGMRTMSYEWTCSLSANDTFTEPLQTCTFELLPSYIKRSFTVSADVLKHVHRQIVLQDDSASYFIRYSLKIGVSDAMSSSVSLIVEVLGVLSEVASLSNFDIVNGRGTSIDWQRVRFYDDIVIAPEGDRVTWTFDILSPALDAKLFQFPDNLITHHGYYNPNTNVTQSFPLGIRAGTLRPARVYDIAVRLHSEETYVSNSLVRIRIRTVDAPKLLLSPLAVSHGDTQTLFTASARVNLDSKESFSFFFFLVSSNGEEICLDGCSGSSIVQFHIMEIGVFRLLARLRDVQGTSVLDEQFYTSNVTIFPSSVNLSKLMNRSSLKSFEVSLRDMHRLGDHGGVQLLSSALARHVHALENGSNELPEDTTTTISLAVGMMHGIVQNSVPTALTARSYIQTANHFARLTSASIINTLAVLVSIVDNAVMRVPVTEAIDVLQELLTFYNLSMRHVISPFTAQYFGLTVPLSYIRSERLSHQDWLEINTEPSEVRLNSSELLIGFFASLQKHFSIVLSRDAVCGSVERVNTSINNGMTNGEVLFYNASKNILPVEQNPSSFFESFKRNQLPMLTTFSIAVVCRSLRPQALFGGVSRLAWCKDTTEIGDEEVAPVKTPDADDLSELHESPYPLFEMIARQEGMAINSSLEDMQAQKRLFILMETMDYRWLSGLIADELKTATSVLVTTNATLLSGNSLYALNQEKDLCYFVNTSVPRVGLTEGGGCVGARGFLELTQRQSVLGQISSWNIMRAFGLVDATLSSDNSSTMLLQPTHFGVVGAVLSSCPKDARLPSVALPEVGDEFVYGVVGAVITVSTAITVAWSGSSASYASFTGSAVIK